MGETWVSVPPAPGRSVALTLAVGTGYSVCRLQVYRRYSPNYRRLVVGDNAFMKIGRAPVLCLPSMKNLGNTCAGLLVHANNDVLAQLANHHHIIGHLGHRP